MEYRRFGNTIVARIDQGEDVLEKMKRIAMLEDVKLASVSALGTFSSMTVGIYDLEKRQFMGNDFEGMFEIVSFTGTILTLIDPCYDRISKSAVFHRYLLLCAPAPPCLQAFARCRIVFFCAQNTTFIFLLSDFYYKTKFVYTQHPQSLQLLSETHL